MMPIVRASRPERQQIWLSKADISPLEEEFVLDALRSGWVAPLGPHVDAFETEIAARVGVRGALALSSGTAALHLALLALGTRPGDAVLVPSMTFAASANAVVYTGANPVFVDCDPADGNVNAGLLIEAVDALRADGVTVAAAMSVDLFGRCADYAGFVRALADRGVPLVEDAAEGLGATSGGTAAGAFGKLAALSFNGNKIMTTSGGGMLLADDLDLIDRCRYLATQARQPVPHYEHTEIGYNYRLSNILAALGRAQLRRLDDMIARRREIRAQYVAGLADIPGIDFLGRTSARGDGQDNCWLTCLTLDPTSIQVGPEDLLRALAGDGIEARHLWKPLHLQPAFRSARAFIDGGAATLFARGMALPSGSALHPEEIDFVIARVRANLGYRLR